MDVFLKLSLFIVFIFSQVNFNYATTTASSVPSTPLLVITTSLSSSYSTSNKTSTSTSTTTLASTSNTTSTATSTSAKQTTKISSTIPTTTSFSDLNENDSNSTAIVVLSTFAIIGIIVVSAALGYQFFKAKRASEYYGTLNMERLGDTSNNMENSVQMRTHGDDMQIEFTNPAFQIEEETRPGPPNHNRISRSRADSFDD